MIRIENTVVPHGEQWKSLILGARNPMNSWDRSDSEFVKENCEDCFFKSDYSVCKHNPIHKCFDFDIGSNDLDLMTRLSKAGTDHRKFMRMIVVYADIIAPRYWWTEFDTYKIGTVANSCSTMHKIHEKEFTIDDFSCENLNKETMCLFEQIVNYLNISRDCYNSANQENDKEWSKDYWWQMIQLLPQSYNQKRTVMLNYEVLKNMYHSRKAHKLTEWQEFCSWIENLPYSELITQ